MVVSSRMELGDKYEANEFGASVAFGDFRHVALVLLAVVAAKRRRT